MSECLHISLAEDIHLVPFERGRLAYADIARRAIQALEPACIAVDLPREVAPILRQAIALLPEVTAVAYQAAGGQPLFVAADPGDAAVEAVRSGMTLGIPVEFLDTPEGDSETLPVALPDAWIAASTPFQEFAGRALDALEGRESTDRELLVARRVLLLRERHERTLLVLSFGTAAALRRLLRDGVTPGRLPLEQVPREIVLRSIARHELGHVLYEIPNLVSRYEEHRRAPGDAPFEANAALRALLKAAAKRYARLYRRHVNMTEWRALFHYARNLALLHQRLLPRLEELVTAAKACVDDDFGALVFEQAIHHPHNDARPDLPPDEPESDPRDPDFPSAGAEEDEPAEAPPASGARRAQMRRSSTTLYVDFSTGRARIEPAYPIGRIVELVFEFRRRMSRRDIELEWERIRRSKKFLFGSGICSWPPEDARLESFLRHVRQRALERVAESHRMVEEFTTTFLDGIDVRESIRNWHNGRIFVRRERAPRGRIGPVVIIWEDVPLATKGLWRTTLYAENQNESDISIICAPRPGAEIVGPGISRLRYHALLSVFPAAHIPDIWGDPAFIALWRSHRRALIASAILLSSESYVAVVSAAPIDTDLRQLARQVGVEVVHLTPTAFSSNLLERIRTLHILDDKRVRDWADQYIEV